MHKYLSTSCSVDNIMSSLLIQYAKWNSEKILNLFWGKGWKKISYSDQKLNVDVGGFGLSHASVGGSSSGFKIDGHFILIF